jgi:hypothetical protein
MTSPPDTGDIFTLPPEGTGTDALEVFGPTVEFISFSNDDYNQICVMRGVIPPGVTNQPATQDDLRCVRRTGSEGFA